MTRVRTTIEIEDNYIRAIMHRYRLRTKTEAVNLALRKLAGEPMTREEALAMGGSHSIAKSHPTSRPVAWTSDPGRHVDANRRGRAACDWTTRASGLPQPGR